jgi:type 1 fimbriae regulatory protein FimB/type 1 fimbriae regulatory protein FimE
LFTSERRTLRHWWLPHIVARPGSRRVEVRHHTCSGTAAALLANAGVDTRSLQAYLGHRNIHTVRYTELAPVRFKDFWRD